MEIRVWCLGTYRQVLNGLDSSFECAWTGTGSRVQSVPIHFTLKALADFLSWWLAVGRRSRAVFHLFF